ncbi:uncharacterized protein LOC131664155 [Phymastichus coffea]|uniref:uncharacterized protein LOC131664155 n=1 Tax=Phymastichus coffea TaxID=108790 RepID=UPI00273CCB58|nr:uncharacterized protein LOC131664155 [Phymastichus coffea]
MFLTTISASSISIPPVGILQPTGSLNVFIDPSRLLSWLIWVDQYINISISHINWVDQYINISISHINWVDALPLVLLGIRSAFKPDIGASSAEFVFGEPLRLPGEMFSSSVPNSEDIPTFLAAIREHVARLRPVPTSRHSKPGIFVFKDLEHCTHVLLREGPELRSLQQPYRGSYEVIERNDKTMTLKIYNKPITVTIDTVKPAFILNDQEPPPTNIADSTLPTVFISPPKPTFSPTSPASEKVVTTRSGRRVRLPDRFQP